VAAADPDRLLVNPPTWPKCRSIAIGLALAEMPPRPGKTERTSTDVISTDDVDLQD
jgi:hypothetical protein